MKISTVNKLSKWLLFLSNNALYKALIALSVVLVIGYIQVISFVLVGAV